MYHTRILLVMAKQNTMSFWINCKKTYSKAPNVHDIGGDWSSRLIESTEAGK